MLRWVVSVFCVCGAGLALTLAQPGGPKAPEDRAVIVVRVPADAKVTIGGQPFEQPGTERNFTTQPIGPGVFSVDVAAAWTEGGKEVRKSEAVRFERGKVSTVSFGAPKPLPPTETKKPETKKPDEPKKVEPKKTEEPKKVEPKKTEEPKKVEPPKAEPKKSEAPKKTEEPKKVETPKADPKKVEVKKVEEPKKVETPKAEPKKVEVKKVEEPKKVETPKAEPKKADVKKTEEPKKVEAPKVVEEPKKAPVDEPKKAGKKKNASKGGYEVIPVEPKKVDAPKSTPKTGEADRRRDAVAQAATFACPLQRTLHARVDRRHLATAV